MRPISLRFSLLSRLLRGPRGLLPALVVLCMWLLLCQPATAAVNCTAAVTSQSIVYNGSAISGAGLGATISCSGLPPTGNSGNENYYNMCTTGDAASASGSGGTSVTPYRVAKSAAGNTLNYQLLSGFNPFPPLDQGNLLLWHVIIGPNSSTITSHYTPTPGAGIRVSVPASQNVPAGDYISMVPLTVQLRYLTTSSGTQFTDCTNGTLANTAQVTVPVRIRVGGASCEWNPSSASSISFGDISVTGGTVAAMSANAFLNLTCANGIAWTVTLSDGNNALGSGTDRRRMVNGSSYLNYTMSVRIFSSGTGTGANQQSIVGATLTQQTPASLTPGVYSDVVIVTLNY